MVLRTRQTRFMLCMLLAAALAIQTGCATRGDVVDIVTQSNRDIVAAMESANRTVVTATVAGSVPDINLESSRTVPVDWQQTAAKIEAFIAEHPDMPRTIHALRLRQAILYLSVDQRNLALLAFRDVDTSQLANARDRAIVEVHETLVWWYSVTGPTLHAFSAEDQQKAKEGMERLAKVSAGLAEAHSTQRLLGQMRVRIANRLARSLSNPPDIKATLKNGLDQYTAQFDTSEHRLIQDWHLKKDDDKPAIPLSELRWYDYVPKAFLDAEDLWKPLASTQGPADFTPPWVACILQGSCP